MEFDALLLSRIQFAITIAFHFLFPPLSIGLAWLLVVVERKAWKTGSEDYARLGRYFGNLFAITFAVGVATGIVMEFQFGMNWARYSEFVGDIFGAPLAAEGIFAFFLESTFLGLYLFGRNKVSKGIHWFSILMVAVGSTLSAFWILVANSWQQTPAGYVLRNGRAELTSFSEAVFNPSMWVRFWHTFDACIIMGAFFMAGVAAYLLLIKKESEIAKKALRLAVVVGLVASLLELFPFGHGHAVQVANTQPAKLAAMEGLYETGPNAPLLLFGIPGEKEIKYDISIPGLLSLGIAGDVKHVVRGLNSFPPEDLPPIGMVFYPFHIMVGLGTYFIALMALAVFLLYRKRLFENKLVLKLIMFSAPLPIAAIQLGWIVAEVGRQPWIVYGLLRTKDAYSETVSGGEIFTSIIIFSSVYLFLGALYLFTLLKEIKKGPAPLTLSQEH